MRFNLVSFARSLLLLTIIILVMLPCEAKKDSYKVTDSLAILRWVKPIRDSIFYNPVVILPWLDSLSHFADSTQNPYANYAKNNLKGNYNWAIRNFDTAASYYRSAIKWTVEGGLLRQQINTISNLGLIYSSLDNFDSSVFYYSRAIEMAKQHNFNKIYIESIIKLSIVYNQKSAYDHAIELLEEARIKSESLGNEELNSNLYSAFATVYYYLGDVEKMKEYYLRAINFHLKGNNKNILATLYGNIAESYSSIAKNYDSSTYYFSKTLQYTIPQNKDDVLHMIDFTRGSLFYSMGNYDSAAFYYQRALQNPLSEVFVRRKAALLVNMGNVYRSKLDYPASVDYYKKGYQLSDSIDVPEYKSNALLGLMKIDSVRGDFEQAFFYSIERQQIQAELKKDEARSHLMASEVARALEVQNLKNSLLQTENKYKDDMINNQRWIVVMIVWVLIGMLVFTLFQFMNHKKIKRLNKLLESNIIRLDAQNLELDQLNKTKDKFFSIVSHDLRSPFAALRTGTILLNMEWESLTEEEKRELVLQLDKSAENTNNLLEELLQWSKMQQGAMKLVKKTFTVNTLIKELKEVFASIANDKGIQLIAESDDKQHLTTDYQMLKQLLHNLLTNAVKFTPRGGEIKIELQFEPGMVSITVRDTGIGIPKEKQGGIFELNSNFNRPGTEGEKSSGMGLILCMDYARLMGAKLELVSEVGRGSAFTVIFKT
ncbi:MAG: ATP-binding protein [Bacteroidales bacterium]|nr:ATP-binding protein [Bacteroidales bacterium]